MKGAILLPITIECARLSFAQAVGWSWRAILNSNPRPIHEWSLRAIQIQCWPLRAIQRCSGGLGKQSTNALVAVKGNQQMQWWPKRAIHQWNSGSRQWSIEMQWLPQMSTHRYSSVSTGTFRAWKATCSQRATCAWGRGYYLHRPSFAQGLHLHSPQPFICTAHSPLFSQPTAFHLHSPQPAICTAHNPSFAQAFWRPSEGLESANFIDHHQHSPNLNENLSSWICQASSNHQTTSRSFIWIVYIGHIM